MSCMLEGAAVEYPCEWEFRLIGESENELLNAAFSVLDKKFSHKSGNSSSSGKYVSVSVSVRVDSQGERDTYFTALQASSAVKFVL